MKKRELCTVAEQVEIADGIFDLRLAAPEIAAEASAGQFVDLYLNDRSRILPRPVSLCGISRSDGELRLVYRVSGKNTGTEELSRMNAGEKLYGIGPLGNGFPLEEAAGKSTFLIGGGIGIPPMLETVKQLCRLNRESGFHVTNEIVLGYKSTCFLADEFVPYGNVSLATEDGSAGVTGTVLDAIRENALTAELIFACGPKPMLRALKEYTAEKQIPCWISMEERMACGIGACLGCVCGSAEVDGHSHVKNKRVCKDGPVFPAEEIVL